MKKSHVKMNKPIYLGIPILDESKTLMYEFWYDYLKRKYNDDVKLCYMDTNSFVTHIKTEDFFSDTNNDVEKWFDTSNFDKNDNRPMPIDKNKKALGLFKGELGGKIMKQFSTLRPKTYAYLLDADSEIKKAKGTKRCVIKSKLMFENYEDSLFNKKIIMQSQLRLKSDYHDMYTEEINKVALNSCNDDKRTQIFDGVTTYPYGAHDLKRCEVEILAKKVDITIKL